MARCEVGSGHSGENQWVLGSRILSNQTLERAECQWSPEGDCAHWRFLKGVLYRAELWQSIETGRLQAEGLGTAITPAEDVSSHHHLVICVSQALQLLFVKQMVSDKIYVNRTTLSFIYIFLLHPDKAFSFFKAYLKCCHLWKGFPACAITTPFNAWLNGHRMMTEKCPEIPLSDLSLKFSFGQRPLKDSLEFSDELPATHLLYKCKEFSNAT